MRVFPIILLALIQLSCHTDDSATPVENFKYLALGDSYTIGESVPYADNYPSQLEKRLALSASGAQINTHIIATTGWTTTDLINGIAQDGILHHDYDLVTLLIGVNNQYQHKPFSLYQTEFPQLVQTAIGQAKGLKSHVIVISIPDYAYTPFGQGTGNATQISSELQQYNAFAQQYCQQNGVAFVNITDITQNGLNDTSLVASDGLHPSSAAYALFVDRLLPVALPLFQN